MSVRWRRVDCSRFCDWEIAFERVVIQNWGNDRVLELEFEMALALALRTNAA